MSLFQRHLHAMKLNRRSFTAFAFLFLGLWATADGLPSAIPIRREFIVDSFPTPANHASTIVQTSDGSLLSAWFGGTAEGKLDVVIWSSRLEPAGWSRPVVVARGEEDGDDPFPCWNPVLFQVKNGPLILFYKVGPKPSSWWGRYRISRDNGASWSQSKRIGSSMVGPVRNKPLELPDGTLLCGSSDESSGWRVHLENIVAFGTRKMFWTRTPDLNYAIDYGAIQPALIPWSNKRIQMLCRTRQKVITESWSVDGGKSWSAFRKTALPNPNSAIDAVLLADGRAVLIHNPNAEERTPLIASFSKDGTEWTPAVTLENEPGAELSYPAVIQTSDGLVHVTYTWKREKIRHAVLDPAQVQ